MVLYNNRIKITRIWSYKFFFLTFLFSFQVDTLKCYAPKIEWSKSRMPVVSQNSFELVRCNTGLQRCFGGCKHCMANDGPLQVKGCAGDMDITLEMLGLDQDACKNLTSTENKRFKELISSAFDDDKRPHLPSFTRLCRCSWDGCNGLSTLELLQNKSIFAQNNSGHRISLPKHSFPNYLNQSFILTIMIQSLYKCFEYLG